MNSGIYKITCSVNGRFYIGSSSDIKQRWRVHRWHLRRGGARSPHMQRSWDKYGEQSFIFEIIEFVETHRLVEREQYYFDVLKPFGSRGFNVAPVAGVTRGHKRTREQIEKTASKNRGRKLSAERRKQLSEAGRGRKATEETRRKLRARKMSPETREKMRQARLANNWQRGKPMNDRQRAALSHQKGEKHPWWGRKHSEDSKRKVSMSKSSSVVQIDAVGNQIMVWGTARDAAAFFGLRDACTIYRSIKSDGRRTAAGFRWQYSDRAVVS